LASTITGVLTLNSTITNGTYTYTLPSATGTLALTSNITSAISGTTNYLPKFSAASTINDSVIQQSSTLIGINVSPSRVLHLSSSGSNSAIRLDNTVSGRPFLLTFDDSQNLTFINSSDSGIIAFNTGTGTSTTKFSIANGGAATFSSTVQATQYTATSTGGSGLRVYGSAGTNQWDIYLNSTNLRFSDNTGTGSIVFDRLLSGTNATMNLGSSSVPTAANSAFYPSASTSTTAYAGTYYDGSTAYSSFFGRVPSSISSINDGVGYITISGVTPTLRVLFSNSEFKLNVPLSGTSATFSGNGSSFGSASVGTHPLIIQTNVSEQSIKFIGKNNNNNVQFFDSAGTTYQAVVGTIGTDFIIGTGTSGTTRLTIASTGAASFTIPVESPASGTVCLTLKTSNGANDIFRWFDGTTQLGVFKNSGNVGIGTASPTAKLDVSGYGTANSIMTQPVAYFNGSNGFALGSDGTNALIGVSNSGTDMIFLKRVAGVYSEAMRIASTGAATFSSSVTATSVNVVYNNAITNSTTDGVTLATYTTGASNELLQLAITLTNNNTTTQVRCTINYTTDNNNAVSLAVIATTPLNAYGEGQDVVALNVKNGTTLTVVLLATAGPINWSSKIAITKIL